MKTLLSLIISGALVVSGHTQTRNVLVGTNNTVVQPTNFWSADASNARTGLGLGTAATNPASAFQPSSGVLSNLASSNAVNLTNLRATNIVGVIPASNIPSTTLTNIPATNIVGTVALASNVTGTIAISNGGTGATNAGGARTNLGLGSTNDVAFNIVDALKVTSGGLAPTYTLDIFNGSINFTTNPIISWGSDDVYFSVPLFFTSTTNAATTRTNLGLGATNGAFVGLSVGTQNTNLSTNNSSAFGSQNFIDSDADESFAFGFANTISNMPAGAGGSVVMGGRGNMTNQGAFLFNGVPQGGTIGNSRGNNTFAVNASNGIYLNGSLFLEAIQGGSTDSAILQIGSGGGVSRTMTNKSTAVPAFFGWSGFANTAFSAAEARTNIGLSFAALTNTNTAGFNTSLYGSGTNPVLYNTNGEVVSPTNFWQVAPIVTRFVEFDPPTNATTNIVAARNLHIHSLAISRTGVTSTIALPTNNVFDGDIALVVHQGPTSSVTAIRQAGAGTNLITLNQPEEAVEFVYYNNVWQFNHNRSFVEPIYFSGTNASANAAASRTNLGLGSTNSVTFGGVTTAGIVYDGEAGLRSIDLNEGRLLAGTNLVFSWEPSGVVTEGTHGFLGPVQFEGSSQFDAIATFETNVTINGNVTLGSGDNIVLSTTNGTKIGTATNQLLGFYDQTPITQPSSTGVTTNGFTRNSGDNVHPQSTFTGGIGTNAYTISDVVAHLKSLGLLAP